MRKEPSIIFPFSVWILLQGKQITLLVEGKFFSKPWVDECGENDRVRISFATPNEIIYSDCNHQWMKPLHIWSCGNFLMEEICFPNLSLMKSRMCRQCVAYKNVWHKLRSFLDKNIVPMSDQASLAWVGKLWPSSQIQCIASVIF